MLWPFSQLYRYQKVNVDDAFIISSDNHKRNAILYDRIIPMHSNRRVPSRYQVDVSLCYTDIPEFNEFIERFVRFFDGVQNSPRDSIALKGNFFFGEHGLLGENGAYGRLFTGVDSDLGYKKLDPMEFPFAWLRDASALLLYEVLWVNGYKNAIPVFTSRNLYSSFLTHGGLFMRSPRVPPGAAVIEVVHDNFFEILEDRTEWAQVREIRRDEAARIAIRGINRILIDKYRPQERNELDDKISEVIEAFEASAKKHGLQYRRARRFLYIDIATATSLSFFTTMAYINGAALPLTLSALAGTVFSTAKAVFSFDEKRTSIEMPKGQVVNYVEAVRSNVRSTLAATPTAGPNQSP